MVFATFLYAIFKIACWCFFFIFLMACYYTYISPDYDKLEKWETRGEKFFYAFGFIIRNTLKLIGILIVALLAHMCQGTFD